jgi:glycosyltransferase involved in cell wall biosynthesis
MKNVLWLASWYPNKYHPFTGDFLERHARAASLYNKITVLHLVKDHTGIVHSKYFIDRIKYNNNCSALILYYKPLSRIKVVESLFSGFRYSVFFISLVRLYIRENGLPDLLHVQVAWRAGLIALYCRSKYKLQYAVSEQWSGFMPGASPSFKEKPFLIRWLIRKIYKNASWSSAVSEQLAGILSARFSIKKPVVIPNVVDSTLFVPSFNKNNIFRFIHISEFNFQKNPEQITEALSLLRARTEIPFELCVFAPDEKEVIACALQYKVDDIVKYRSYVPQKILALEMNRSDALILYSRFETFGCVVIEAMASGVPVIVSDIPVMHELVQSGTGIIVAIDDPSLLAEKMLWMMENRNQFNSASIAAYAAGQYSFERIGKLFDGLYNN